jgi:hypothetical protein
MTNLLKNNKKTIALEAILPSFLLNFGQNMQFSIAYLSKAPYKFLLL